MEAVQTQITSPEIAWLRRHVVCTWAADWLDWQLGMGLRHERFRVH